MVYEGYSEGFINKLITGKARVVSDKNCGLLQPIYWDRSNDLKLPMVNVLLTFDDLGYPNFRKPPICLGKSFQSLEFADVGLFMFGVQHQQEPLKQFPVLLLYFWIW